MNGFDKFMWSVSEVVLAVLAYVFVIGSDTSAVAKAGWLSTATGVIFLIYPMRVYRLVKRRRNWRP
jgi:hypothetical protein